MITMWLNNESLLESFDSYLSDDCYVPRSPELSCYETTASETDFVMNQSLLDEITDKVENPYPTHDDKSPLCDFTMSSTADEYQVPLIPKVASTPSRSPPVQQTAYETNQCYFEAKSFDSHTNNNYTYGQSLITPNPTSSFCPEIVKRDTTSSRHDGCSKTYRIGPTEMDLLEPHDLIEHSIEQPDGFGANAFHVDGLFSPSLNVQFHEKTFSPTNSAVQSVNDRATPSLNTLRTFINNSVGTIRTENPRLLPEKTRTTKSRAQIRSPNKANKRTNKARRLGTQQHVRGTEIVTNTLQMNFFPTSDDSTPVVSYEKKKRGPKPTHKLFPCLTCGKTFPSRSKVKRHQLVHTQEKNHECEFCHNKFGQRSAMLVHQRRKHCRAVAASTKEASLSAGVNESKPAKPQGLNMVTESVKSVVRALNTGPAAKKSQIARYQKRNIKSKQSTQFNQRKDRKLPVSSTSLNRRK